MSYAMWHLTAWHREIPLKIAKKKLRRIHSVEKELSGGHESALPSPIACVRYAPPSPEAANSDVLQAIPSTNAVVFGYAPLCPPVPPSRDALDTQKSKVCSKYVPNLV